LSLKPLSLIAVADSAIDFARRHATWWDHPNVNLYYLILVLWLMSIAVTAAQHVGVDQVVVA
jgi:hypothetical protein